MICKNKKGGTNIRQSDGMIIKALSGFFDVYTANGVYRTKPRGVFRHRQEKPLVGDCVTIEYDPQDENHQATLLEIKPRKNALVRPPVANIDKAIVAMSLVEPNFSYSLLDHYLISVESNDIKGIIVLTKFDLLINQVGQIKALDLVDEIRSIYEPISYQVLVKNDEKSFKDDIKQIMDEGLFIVMGQSGVGKSTLINQLLPGINLMTAEISGYLNRGKHTTRDVSLYEIGDAWLADTPGFSAIDFPHIEKDELGRYFPELLVGSLECRFRGCLHFNEPDCAVKNRVEKGEISNSRYQNYLSLLEKISNRKPVYRKK